MNAPILNPAFKYAPAASHGNVDAFRQRMEQYRKAAAPAQSRRVIPIAKQ